MFFHLCRRCPVLVWVTCCPSRWWTRTHPSADAPTTTNVGSASARPLLPTRASANISDPKETKTYSRNLSLRTRNCRSRNHGTSSTSICGACSAPAHCLVGGKYQRASTWKTLDGNSLKLQLIGDPQRLGENLHARLKQNR